MGQKKVFDPHNELIQHYWPNCQRYCDGIYFAWPEDYEYDYEGTGEKKEPEITDKQREIDVKLHEKCPALHYCHSIYAIMLGSKWEEEWDDRNEVIKRAIDVARLGYLDYKRNVHFTEDHKLLGDKSSNTLMRNLYDLGQELAKAHVSENIINKFMTNYHH